MTVSFYDSPNNFYAKIIKSKELIECEIDDDVSEPRYTANYPDYAINPKIIGGLPFKIDMFSHIIDETIKINDKLKEIYDENDILLKKEQIVSKKLEKYSNLLNEIKNNKTYSFRKFRKTLVSYIDSLTEELNSGYFKPYEVKEYEQAVKCNMKLLKKLFKERL